LRKTKDIIRFPKKGGVVYSLTALLGLDYEQSKALVDDPTQQDLPIQEVYHLIQSVEFSDFRSKYPFIPEIWAIEATLPTLFNFPTVLRVVTAKGKINRSFSRYGFINSYCKLEC
jgi:hypothetical protein